MTYKLQVLWQLLYQSVIIFSRHSDTGRRAVADNQNIIILPTLALLNELSPIFCVAPHQLAEFGEGIPCGNGTAGDRQFVR